MWNRSRLRWLRRAALGLACVAVIFAGRVSAGAAGLDDCPDGFCAGPVDTDTAVPLSGIPYGDDQILPEDEVQVIPYLSHGILTEEDAKAASARALVSRNTSGNRPDGDQIAIKNVLQSRGRLSPAELAFVNAVVGAKKPLRDPLEPHPVIREPDEHEQDEPSEQLTPQHQGTDYPE